MLNMEIANGVTAFDIFDLALGGRSEKENLDELLFVLEHVITKISTYDIKDDPFVKALTEVENRIALRAGMGIETA
jgi:hypothetical protein